MEELGSGEERGRRISRRRRAGFAFSTSDASDSTHSEGVGNINEAVEAEATREPTPPASSQSLVAGSPSEEFNPQARLEQVRQRSSTYEKEYRLNLLHRLMMRRIPMDEIAAQLGVSIATVYRDRDELRAKLREEARGLDIDEIVGDSKGFYDEVGAMAMRAASNSNAPLPMRLAAMRTGLAAKNDMHRFFQTAGVYDVLRFRVAQDGSSVTDVRRLMENTERLLAGDKQDFSNAASEVIDSGDNENLEL